MAVVKCNGRIAQDIIYREGLSYIKLGPKAGIGGPGRVIHKQEWEEDSY